MTADDLRGLEVPEQIAAIQKSVWEGSIARMQDAIAGKCELWLGRMSWLTAADLLQTNPRIASPIQWNCLLDLARQLGYQYGVDTATTEYLAAVGRTNARAA